MKDMSPYFQVEIVCNEQMPPKDMTLKQLWLSQWMGKVSLVGGVFRLFLFSLLNRFIIMNTSQAQVAAVCFPYESVRWNKLFLKLTVQVGGHKLSNIFQDINLDNSHLKPIFV